MYAGREGSSLRTGGYDARFRSIPVVFFMSSPLQGTAPWPGPQMFGVRLVVARVPRVLWQHQKHGQHQKHQIIPL